MDCNTLPSWWSPDGLYWVRFDQLALHAIAGQLPTNSLIGPHRLSSASIPPIFRFRLWQRAVVTVEPAVT